MSSEAVMVTKERAKRKGQGAFASHPEGMAVPAPERRRNARTGGYWPTLRVSP